VRTERARRITDFAWRCWMMVHDFFWWRRSGGVVNTTEKRYFRYSSKMLSRFDSFHDMIMWANRRPPDSLFHEGGGRSGT
jgi:hypothetical protein